MDINYKKCPFFKTQCLKENCLAYTQHSTVSGEMLNQWTCMVLNKIFFDEEDFIVDSKQ